MRETKKRTGAKQKPAAPRRIGRQRGIVCSMCISVGMEYIQTSCHAMRGGWCPSIYLYAQARLEMYVEVHAMDLDFLIFEFYILKR